MQRQGLDAIKRMAQMAKNRLRKKVNEKENKTAKSGSFKIIFGDGIDIKNKIITREDKKLYEKVKAIVDGGETVFNPIARLIDYKIFNKIGEQEKERYLLDLVDKFKRYKEKYQEEKQIPSA